MQVVAADQHRTHIHRGGHRCNHSHHHSQAELAKDLDVTDLVSRSPGVKGIPEGQRPRLTLEQATTMVAMAAQQAAVGGTYGVAGLLLGPHRELIATSVNAVFKDGKMKDPTAHGERQLVDWYFTQVKDGAQLPPPEQLTIISSLDPCMMCAGSILSAGMDVYSLSYDKFGGVDYNEDGRFSTVPEELRGTARQQFSYFGIHQGREFHGQDGIYQGGLIPESVEKQALDAFMDSRPMVEKFMEALDVDPKDFRDAAELLKGGPEGVLDRARSIYPETLTLKVADPENPGPELAPKLLDMAAASQAEGHNYDAAALIDPFGNVLVMAGSREGVSPIQTPLFEISRAYNEMRNQVGAEGKNYFPPFKYCKLVTLQGPSRDGASVAELGAFCSSVKGKFPEGSERHWQYIVPNQTQEQLEEMVHSLPPRYSQTINPDIQRVRNPELIELVSQAYVTNTAEKTA